MTDTKKLKEYLASNYKRMLASPTGDFRFPAFVLVSSYRAQLWDWDSYFASVGISQIASDRGEDAGIYEYAKGCVRNFLDRQAPDGSIPIIIASDPSRDLARIYPHKNVHKPVLVQHAAFVTKQTGDAEWLREDAQKLENYLKFYETHAKHESGLFYFFDDFAIGVDNDPCTFYRPDNSSASIYLNTFIYKEFEAMSFIYEKLGNAEKAAEYARKKDELKDAINSLCYDEKDGLYYSCDLNLNKIDPASKLHSGAPRHYSTLIQRLGVWSCFMPLWAGIATPEQAERMVRENLLDEKAFWGKTGVRSLSKYEKMYRIVTSSNPSSWQGAVWTIANYLIFRGLVRYGFFDEAKEICEKMVKLLADDIEKNATLHECYDPETGEGVCNKDFLSWNMLAENMISYYENGSAVEEF